MKNIKEAPIFLFERVIKKRGFFYISEKTLQDIKFGIINGKMVYSPKQIAFEKLLERERLVLVKLKNSDMSVIKKI
jgi:hypothetical protein